MNNQLRFPLHELMSLARGGLAVLLLGLALPARLNAQAGAQATTRTNIVDSSRAARN